MGTIAGMTSAYLVSVYPCNTCSQKKRTEAPLVKYSKPFAPKNTHVKHPFSTLLSEAVNSAEYIHTAERTLWVLHTITQNTDDTRRTARPCRE